MLKQQTVNKALLTIASFTETKVVLIKWSKVKRIKIKFECVTIGRHEISYDNEEEALLIFNTAKGLWKDYLESSTQI